ncbi:MAG: hypothetical protein ACE5JS_22695 [Nitrospinota bacterium]
MSPTLNRLILDIVERQIRGNDPPETRQTFNRLRKEGYSEQEAKNLIGTVVVCEMYDTLKEERPFDQARFASALENLPELPFEDDE